MTSPSQARRFLLRSCAAKQIYAKNDNSKQHGHLGYTPILSPEKSFSSISYSIWYLESNMISSGQEKKWLMGMWSNCQAVIIKDAINLQYLILTIFMLKQYLNQMVPQTGLFAWKHINKMFQKLAISSYHLLKL